LNWWSINDLAVVATVSRASLPEPSSASTERYRIVKGQVGGWGTMSDYVFDNAQRGMRDRLAQVEATFDPNTIAQLEARGVAPGWRCLEVGGGGGSIAAWLARRVAPTGTVLATDLDTRFLDALDLPGLSIRRHDITIEPLPEGAFDLVHARAVLHHLAAPETALARLVVALAPGGWLVVADPDWVSFAPDPALNPVDAALLERLVAAHYALVQARGVDPFYGRRLYRQLLRLGLADVGAAGSVPLVRGGSAIANLFRTTVMADHHQADLLAGGLVDAADLAAGTALLDDPAVVVMGPSMVTAWGRRSAS
jgi:SAM-dependent methyltransferase